MGNGCLFSIDDGQFVSQERGSVKVNTDGAFTAADYSGATGAVICRADGSFLAASARRLDSVASVLMTEAEALRDGILLIPQGTLDRVIAIPRSWCLSGDRAERTGPR